MSERRPWLAQWPVFAATGCLFAGQLLLMLPAVFDLGRTAPARWLPIAASLILLGASEGALLGLANGALERALAGASTRWLAALDLAKALLLAALVALSGAAMLKFRATGGHLRRSDLWFAYANWRQLLAEAQPREVTALLLLPAGVVAIAALGFAALRWTRRRAKSPPLARALAVAASAIAALAVLWTQSPNTTRFAREFVPEARWLHARFAARQDLGTPDEATREAAGAPIAPYRPVAPTQPLNLVLVMLESLSWDLVDRHSAAAPNLIRRHEEGVAFTRAYSPSTHSDYAQMAVLSSLHPRKYPDHDFYQRLDYPRTLLWDALAPAGYTTAMFSCQNERWGNMLRYLDTPGLEVLRHAPDWPRAARHGEGVESKVFEETPVREWQAWLERGAVEPFFTYLNFQATHFPYSVPPGAPQPFAPFALDFPATFVAYPHDKTPVMANRFANALAYADTWLGEVVATLESRGLAERTVLAVAADHGEAFYEHGQPTHGTSLYEEQVRSLLLFRAPGLEPRRVAEPVSLLDVAPTALRLLGLPPHGNFQGRTDILDPSYRAAGRSFAFTLQGLVHQDGLLRDDMKWIVDHDQGELRLFDLRTDPAELRDIAPDRPDLAAALAAELDDFLARQLNYYRDRGWERGRYPPRLP